MEEDTIIIPYEYIVQLDNKKLSLANNKIIIYFKGNKIMIDKNIFKFASLKQLSLKDISLMLSGTKGIISISGKFADDK